MRPAGAIVLAALVLVGAVAFTACNNSGAIVDWVHSGSLPVHHLALALAAVAIAVAIAWPKFRVWCFESFFALFGFFGSNAFSFSVSTDGFCTAAVWSASST